MAPKKTKKKTKSRNSTASTTSSSSTFSFEVVNTSLPQTLPGGPYAPNPYQFHGPRYAFEAKTVEEGFYVRIDMPGVGKDSVQVMCKNNKLTFNGIAPPDCEFESGSRNYRGEIIFSMEPLDLSDCKVDMSNGVLRVVLVGSGFPPNYSAASFHSDKKGPETISISAFIINDIMLMLKGCKMVDQAADSVGIYPFQLDGSKGAREMRGLSDEYCFERIDMPDVDSDGLTMRMSDRKISYGGDGVKGSKYDEGKRLYFGEFVLQCPCACNLIDMEGDIIDGVLRIFMKKEKAESSERVGHTNCSEAGPPR